MIAWLKVVHILALTVWCAGLLMLPSLYAQRSRAVTRDALNDLHRLTRRMFIRVTSPAGFVAVVAGTVLLFAQEAFTAWMMLKLVAVGVLVGLHIRAGYVVIGLFEPGRRYAGWRQALSTGATVAAITAILLLVLAKPAIDLAGVPAWMRQPGGLQARLGATPLSAWTSSGDQSRPETMRPMP
ncbi:CopD family protein [Rhodoplanes roseus]|uniref:Protoporphyrinogen IX oxidase n=1 Tax=Rhodoplanes roseus TaxID=29409 RepID=A0A327KYE7_9BRAD|nr:CopD family protein [Rhodoplanes roseus]RAI43106.1 hypothetical protein CH341_16080 [Rhodoplanes roseus]